MPRWWKVLLAASVVMFVLLAGALRVVANVAVSEHARPALEQARADAERFWPDVLADLDAIKADPFFSTPRRGGDAGERLHEILPWLDDAPDDPSASDRSGEPKERALALPDELLESLRGFEVDDADLVPRATLDALDFAWMKDLERYGYWELTSHPRFAGGEPIDGLGMPTPDYRTLQAWAKLRLLDGNARGDLTDARREVRHLAWLSLTTEKLIGAMVGVALLGFEEKARAAFTPDEPPAVPTRDAMKQLSWALTQLRHEALPVEIRDRALSASRGTVALCVAIGESSITEPLVRSLLHDHYLEAYAERDALIATPPPPCRLRLAKRMREASPDAASAIGAESASIYEMLVPDSTFERAVDLVLLRPVRHAAGHVLGALGLLDGYRMYRERDARARDDP